MPTGTARNITPNTKRLDTSTAVDTRKEKVELEELWERGWLITLDFILFDSEDSFEAMRVDKTGHVTVWTKKRVWFTRFQGDEVVVDKMVYVDRNPIET